MRGKHALFYLMTEDANSQSRHDGLFTHWCRSTFCSGGTANLIYGAAFDARVNNFGIRQIRIAPRSPWQNGYAERFVGTLRREVLDHVIVLGERHLLRLVRLHAAYYNEDRPHMALRRDAPIPRIVEPTSCGRVVALPRVDGLHHRYAGAA